MLSDDNSFTSDLIGKAADYVLKAATDYPLIAVGTAIAGTAGYYVLRCLKNKSNTDKLIVAIKEKDVTLAKQLISTMSPDELNKTNTSKSTPYIPHLTILAKLQSSLLISF